mmetsp:Transcript_3050/g.6766  ORF Transcript_3050/g.6766 Transcript_3050/m.6766 type:complete len:136 (-) Transcript_3050:1350-1757(-)
MNDSDVAGFEKSINKNSDALARLEAEIVQKRFMEQSKQERLDDNVKSINHVQKQSVRRRKHRANAAQAEERAVQAEEELKRAQQEKQQAKEALEREQQKQAQFKYETARNLLKAGLSIDMIMTATGLTKEEIKNL